MRSFSPVQIIDLQTKVGIQEMNMIIAWALADAKASAMRKGRNQI